MKISYTIQEAVAATGIGKSTLYKRIAEKKLKTKKEGTRTLITHAELSRYVEGLPPAQ